MKNNKGLWTVCIFIAFFCMIFSVTSFTLLYTMENDSAYSVAVKNGFEGTETEWLESLKGESLTVDDLYEKAVENGYSGTINDFILNSFNITSNISNSELGVHLAIRSCVSVLANFNGSTSAGSGVIYSMDNNGNAYVITNYHVIYNSIISPEIYLYLYGSASPIEAGYIGGSLKYDVAVLKVTNSDVLKNSSAISATIIDSNTIKVGTSAIAIGNPEGDGISVTQGIVSVDSEYITMTGADDVTNVEFRVLRIDTAINGGNSGGGLFNSNGELIGIVNAKMTKTDIDGIGYALPSNVVKGVVQNIIDNNGTLKVLILGVKCKSTNFRSVYNSSTLTNDLMEDVYVNEVTSGSFAGLIGLKNGDKFVSITIDDNTKTIDRMFTIRDFLLSARAGSNVSITVLRSGSEVICSGTVLPIILTITN